jgi:hypothetical protein
MSVDECLNNVLVAFRNLKVLPGVSSTVDLCEMDTTGIKLQACLSLCQHTSTSRKCGYKYLHQLRVRKR